MIGISLLELIFLLLFIAIPYLIVGPPTSLFSIRNHDVRVHELSVEIYDSKNNSVINETYELSAGEEVYHAKPFRFHVPGFEVVDYSSNLLSIMNLRKHIVRISNPGTLLK